MSEPVEVHEKDVDGLGRKLDELADVLADGERTLLHGLLGPAGTGSAGSLSETVRAAVAHDGQATIRVRRPDVDEVDAKAEPGQAIDG